MEPNVYLEKTKPIDLPEPIVEADKITTYSLKETVIDLKRLLKYLKDLNAYLMDFNICQ